MRRFAILLCFAVGCGGDDAVVLDASEPIDGLGDVDAPEADAMSDATVDAGMDATTVPLAGFGTITGMCGVLTPAELDGTSPLWFQGTFDFMQDAFNDPAERPLLTPGGRRIVETPNAGGSSLYSEVFAYEWLARCELAALLKTETEIVYDVDGKKADILVEIDERKVGVSVVRFIKYPFDSEYLVSDALPLVQRKIEDLRLATSQVSAGDLWTSQMVVAIAYSSQHAQAAMQAWTMLDASVRGSTIFIVVVSEGEDMFIYTDMAP